MLYIIIALFFEIVSSAHFTKTDTKAHTVSLRNMPYYKAKNDQKQHL
jgi:hypothetical protein